MITTFLLFIAWWAIGTTFLCIDWAINFDELTTGAIGAAVVYGMLLGPVAIFIAFMSYVTKGDKVVWRRK